MCPLLAVAGVPATDATHAQFMSDDLLALVAEHLHDDVARCAAAAGYRLIPGDARECRRDWLRTRAVVLDPPAVATLAPTSLPRRGGEVGASAVSYTHLTLPTKRIV